MGVYIQGEKGRLIPIARAGGYSAVDSKLSETSVNPVENSVITSELQSLSSRVDWLEFGDSLFDTRIQNLEASIAQFEQMKQHIILDEEYEEESDKNEGEDSGA